MSASNNFITRPVLSTVCSLLIVIVGLIAIPILPIENLPDIAPPTVKVSATYVGADAVSVEQGVTTVLEQQINGVEEMDFITSNSSSDGVSSISVSFNSGTDGNINQVNVQNRVALAEPQLPEEVRKAGVTVNKASNSILLVYNFVNADPQKTEYSVETISGYLDKNLTDNIKRVPGVGEVTYFGNRKIAFRLWLDPDRLAANGLTSSDVVRQLQSQNRLVPAGKVGGAPAPKGQEFTFTVQLQGRLTTEREFENIVLKTTDDGGLVKLRDVGRVSLGGETYGIDAMDLKGTPSVGVAVYQLSGSNAIEVSNGVKDVIAAFEESLPVGMETQKIYDTTDFINQSIKGVTNSLRDAVILVVLILFLFLQNWKATLVPAIAIPVALIGTFALVLAFGFSLNQLTLFGLVLATGLVVDDAITVVEDTSAKKAEGLSAVQAAIATMDELFGAVIATSLVKMAVFLPVLFFPGATGTIYKQFAATILFSIAISTFNALTFSPMLSGLILRGGETAEPKGWTWPVAGVIVGLAFGRFSSAAFGNWTYVLGVVVGGIAGANLSLIFRVFNTNFSRLQNGYARLIRTLITARRWVMVTLAGGILLTVLAFTALPSAFIPDEDQGYLAGFYQLQNGASLSQTETMARQIAVILKEEKDVLNANVISGYGFNGSSPDQGTILIGLKPLSERPGAANNSFAIADRLNAKLSSLSSGLAVVGQPPAVPGFSAQGGFYFQFNDLTGNYSFNQLDDQAQTLIKAGKASGNFSSLYTQFIPSAPAFGLKVDRAVMGALNVDYKEAMSTIAVLAGGSYTGLTYENGQVRNVYVQAGEEQRDTVEKILSYYVKNRDGDLIQVSQFAEAELSSAPPIISHYNLYRTVLIQGAQAVGKSSGQALSSIQALFKKENFNNIGYAFTGLAALQLSAGSASVLVFGFGILIVYLVLSAQYESYVTPVIILMTVPLAMLGALVFLAIRSIDLNIYAQVGLVTLIGLAAKNGILIVEVAEQHLEDGMNATDAVIASAESRLRPILMTAIAALAGFLPLVVANGAGAQSQQSLGTVIFGGLVVATVLSLGVVPPFYVVIKGLEERFFGRKQGDGDEDESFASAT